LRRANAAGIAWVNGDHYVVFEPATGKDRFSLFDPNQDTLRVLSAAELIKSSQGILLFVAWGQRQLPR
jgi:ABC-type bacteriocin/lantibiotic exporter with double-glycine peptidase domain